jgi:LemA protein
MKKTLIIIGIILSLIFIIFVKFAVTNNKAINLEEQIKESKSGINIQEKRRADLLINMVDAIKSYNNYEQETMTKIIEARSKAINGETVEAEMIITALAEQYPELKSNENYKQYLVELATTENLIAEYRNNYNIQVKEYNKYVKRFPNNLILGMMGYRTLDSTYLEYNATEDAPKDLFK